MKFKLIHNNINVLDLDKSLKFYFEALDMHEVRRINSQDGSFVIVYLADDSGSEHQLELTWMRDKTTSYDLGDNEIHLAFRADNYLEAYAKHKQMGCICYENTDMGIYFISDPDGYWLEVVPTRS